MCEQPRYAKGRTLTRFRAVKPALKSVAVAALILGALGCSKDPNFPNATTSLSGRWVSSDTVDVFTGFDVQVTQAANGVISGNWKGTTRITNGRCDAIYGCAPANTVSGTHLSLRVDLEILGAGSFVGQFATKDLIEGQIIRFGLPYRLRLQRAN